MLNRETLIIEQVNGYNYRIIQILKNLQKVLKNKITIEDCRNVPKRY